LEQTKSKKQKKRKELAKTKALWEGKTEKKRWKR